MALVVAAAAFFLAGCGGGKSTGSAATTSAGGGNAFADCLKKHGVELPDSFGQGGPGQGGPGQGQPPTGGQPPANDPKFQEALDACRDTAPAGGFGSARSTQAFQAYASCLRDHGVDVPDPSASTSTAAGASPTPPSFDRNDPDFAAASQACQALLPAPSTTTTAKL